MPVTSRDTTTPLKSTVQVNMQESKNTRKVDIVTILFSKDAVCYASYLCGRMDVSKAILSFYLLFLSNPCKSLSITFGYLIELCILCATHYGVHHQIVFLN